MTETFPLLQSQIGQETTRSPSPFVRWLRPVVLGVEEGAS